MISWMLHGYHSDRVTYHTLSKTRSHRAFSYITSSSDNRRFPYRLRVVFFYRKGKNNHKNCCVKGNNWICKMKKNRLYYSYDSRDKTENQLYRGTIILKCSLRKYNSTYVLTLGTRVSRPMSGLPAEEDRSRNRVPPYL